MNVRLFVEQVVCPLGAILLLLYCGAFFASSETAFTSLSKIKTRQMLKEKRKNAELVAFLRENLDSVIATVLIGTNFVITLASSLATAFISRVFGTAAIKYGTAVVTILIIIFSEIIPKTYAGIKSEEIAQRSAPFILVLQKVLFLLVWLFKKLGQLISLVEQRFVLQKQPLVTEDELRTLLDVGQNEGTLGDDEKMMLDRIFEFSDLQARDIMKHRSVVRYVNVEDDLPTIVQAFAQSRYSRLPVYEGTTETVVGVLHYKSVLFAAKEITQSKDFVRICMSDVLFIPETLGAIELLRLFKKDREHFAVVLDEYGSNAGVVTMDDVLREVLGRITDEYGMADSAPERRIDVVGTNEFIVPGDMKLDDVNAVLNLDLDSENFDTLGGWLLERFDELPPVGAVYSDKNVAAVFIVEDQSARRIQNVRIAFA